MLKVIIVTLVACFISTNVSAKTITLAFVDKNGGPAIVTENDEGAATLSCKKQDFLLARRQDLSCGQQLKKGYAAVKVVGGSSIQVIVPYQESESGFISLPICESYRIMRINSTIENPKNFGCMSSKSTNLTTQDLLDVLWNIRKQKLLEQTR